MNQCRIRLGFSDLNSHLHRSNPVNSSRCSNPECGRTPESEEDYFLIYPKYNDKRRLLFEILSNKLFTNVNYNKLFTLMPNYTCKILLESSKDASYDVNTSILDDVFKYIDSTKRFSTFEVEEMIGMSTDN